jgi:hypothetical protein
VNTSSGRCGSGANVKTLRWYPVWIERGNGPEEDLAQVVGAAGYVTAGQIGVRVLQLLGISFASSENHMAESRGEALDLRLDGYRHILG